MENTKVKKSLLKKSGKYYVLLGLFIMTIAVVHFALQINFIQKEKLESIETAVEVEKNIEPEIETDAPENQVIGIQPEQYEVKKVEVIALPEYVKPEHRLQKETAPAKPVRKKKEIPETRAARLRRAERILTGV